MAAIPSTSEGKSLSSVTPELDELRNLIPSKVQAAFFQNDTREMAMRAPQDDQIVLINTDLIHILERPASLKQDDDVGFDYCKTFSGLGPWEFWSRGSCFILRSLLRELMTKKKMKRVRRL